MDIQISIDVMLEAVENHYEEVYLIDYFDDTVTLLKSQVVDIEGWIKGIPLPRTQAMSRLYDLIAYEDERSLAETVIDRMQAEGNHSDIYRDVFTLYTNSNDLSVINNNLVRLIYLDDNHRLICANRVNKFVKSTACDNDIDELNIRYSLSTCVAKRAIFAQTYRIPSGEIIHSSFEIQPRKNLEIYDIKTLTDFIYNYEKADVAGRRSRFIELMQLREPSEKPLLIRIPLAGEWENYEIILSSLQNTSYVGSLFAMLIKSNNVDVSIRRHRRSNAREAINLICSELELKDLPYDTTCQIAIVSTDDYRNYNLDEYDRIAVNVFQAYYPSYEYCYYINLDDHSGCFLFWENTDEIEFTNILRNLSKKLCNRSPLDSNLTLSIGWSSFKFFSEIDVSTAYNEANCALRAAQKIGGNRILGYEPEMNDDLWILRMNKYSNTSEIEIRTFGHFDVFIENKPVIFKSQKAKELLALMVDRRGGYITSKEAIEVLWPDEEFNEKLQARYRKVTSRLNSALETYGIADIVKSYRGKRCLDITAVNCDYYKFREDPLSYRNRYSGDYMTGYAWADRTRQNLDEIKHKRKRT